MNDSASTPQKRCSTCTQPFPATPEFFGRDKHTSDGLYPSCKACRKVWRESHKEQIKQQRAARQPQATERMRQYRKTEKNKAYRKEWQVRHYQAHREEYITGAKRNYELHKEEINARTRQYRKDHPEVLTGIDRIHKHKRKAQKRASGGSYTSQDIQDQHRRQKGRCYWCQQKLGKYHIDHVVPLARGGSNDPSNLVLACPDCNMHKHNKLPHEWPEGGRLL